MLHAELVAQIEATIARFQRAPTLGGECYPSEVELTIVPVSD